MRVKTVEYFVRLKGGYTMSAMKLILGVANFSQPYGIKNGKQIRLKEIESILQVAINNGINLIDTSTAYGHENATPVKIIKKIVTPEDYWHYRNCIELAHGFDKINDRQWDGVSVDTSEEALKAAKMKMKRIQLPYNVFDHDINNTNFFKLVKKYNISVMARSVFLQGLLLMDNPPIGKEYIDKLDDIIRPYDISRKEAAFLFTYSHPGIDWVIVGVDDEVQLQELISLTKYTLPMSLVEDILGMGDVPEEIKYPWRWRI
jgi:aryl-alcohol dehydrogenase-like predicted oxidoreductase